MNLNEKTFGNRHRLEGTFFVSGSAFGISGTVGSAGTTDATKNILAGGTAAKGFMSGTYLAAGDYRVDIDPRFAPVEGQDWSIRCSIRGTETGAPSATFFFVSQSNDPGQILAANGGVPFHFQHKQVVTALTSSNPLSAISVNIIYSVDKGTSY